MRSLRVLALTASIPAMLLLPAGRAFRPDPDTTEAGPFAQTGCGFTDEFDRAQLSAGWTWIDPLGDSSYSLADSPGQLRISTPDRGHDLYINFDAPRIVQQVAADFAITTRVTIHPEHNYQGAGLLIWQDTENYIRLERTLVRGVNMGGRVFGGRTFAIEIPFSIDTVYLRLERAGDRVDGWYSIDGSSWSHAGDSQFPAGGTLNVGLALINEWQDNPVSADFEFFNLECAPYPGDADGDGLWDDWEILGATIDPDQGGPLGRQFIDLPAMGADPARPDVFVQIDWMVASDHDHRLSADAIRWIVEAFDASPYVSPTGSRGINLHVDQGQDSIMVFPSRTWGELSRARGVTETNPLGQVVDGEYWWEGSFDAIKNRPGGLFESGRLPIFHYAVSAHTYDTEGHSGVTRDIPSSDFIISLGAFGVTGGSLQQAGTLMHELGHNLGLCHSGPLRRVGVDGCSDSSQNFKPNYLSVMNYSFMLWGLMSNSADGYWDYSRVALPAIDETNLNELSGLGEDASGYGTRHFCRLVRAAEPDDSWWIPVGAADQPIDWNCDGSSNDVSTQYDVNASVDGYIDDTQLLSSHEDWPYLIFSFEGGAIGQSQAGVPPILPSHTAVDELTPEMAERILPLGEISIDINPGSRDNPMNCRSRNGVLPVAVLSTPLFHASTIDANTVRFGPLGAQEAHLDQGGNAQLHIEDVNGDSFEDLIFHFRFADAGLTCDSLEATLTGLTSDHVYVVGTDSIRTVP